MKKIYIGRGEHTTVDDSDYDELIKYRWHLHINPAGNKYVEGSEFLFMHRMLMRPDKGQPVDHINGDGLDNRRENLRLCTLRQNNQNRRPNKNNSSGFKGVGWVKRDSCWQAFIKANKKSIHLGFFTDKTEAAKAYNEAAQKYFGEFAHLNEI